VKALSVSAVGTLSVSGAIVPVPPLALKVTVEELLAAHWA